MSPDDLAKWATSGTPNQIGRKGEFLARVNPTTKTQINIANGSIRIPDKFEGGIITEVKNVKKLSNTAQLRDFASYAGNNEKILYVRPDTQVSKSITQAGWEIRYLWQIPN